MIELLTYRTYGQPRISKPKILKNIKPTYDIKFNKRKVQVYIKDDDVVVYLPDLFSRLMGFHDVEDMSLPTAALIKKYNLESRSVKGFIYADGWLRMYERNEGYLLFKGLMRKIEEAEHLPWLIYGYLEDLARLSKTDPKFDPISSDVLDERWADYDRLLTDIFCKIKLSFKTQIWDR